MWKTTWTRFALLSFLTMATSGRGDTLSDLKDWYRAMDASKGSVDLFPRDISFLRGVQATFTGGLTRYYVDNNNKWFTAWVENWKTASDKLEWSITAPSAGDYQVSALILGANGATVNVSVAGKSINYKVTANGWDKWVLGNISVPAGTSKLTLTATGSFTMSFYSLELIPLAAKADIEAEIRNSRSKATWMKTNPLGMMYQWGQWGGNADGTSSAWPGCYANMDFAKFAQRVKDSGADFLVWSISWATYYIAAPIKSIDNLKTGHTAQTDYLATLLAECEKRGIRVIFYYHWGHGSKPFWDAFWKVPAAGEYAQKETAILNWMNIIREIGERYGTRLSGWMFDDGRIYYPAPYKILGEAARAGNPDRLISYNPWILPRQTDYEDFAFGEGYQGGARNLNNGVYTNGKQGGEQAFGNFQTESGDWGLRKGDKTISTSLSQSQFTTIANRAVNEKTALAFNFRMFENGDQSQVSLDRFKAAVASARAAVGLQVIRPRRGTRHTAYPILEHGGIGMPSPSGRHDLSGKRMKFISHPSPTLGQNMVLPKEEQSR